MTCKFCLAELEEDAVVCPVCGKALKETAEEAENVTEEAVAEEAAETTEETVEAVAEESAEVTEETAEEATEQTDVAEAAEEQPQAEEKKKIKAWKIVLAAVAGVVLLAALACAVLYGLGIEVFPKNDVYRKDSYTVESAVAEKKSDVVVATVGDQILTNSDLQAHYWMNVFSFLNDYGYYLSMMGLDTTKPLDEQVYDKETGMTFQQMFLDDALKSWQRYAILTQMAKEDGFTLSEEEKEYLDTVRTNVEAMAQEEGYTDVEKFIDEKFFPNSSLASYMKYLEVSHIALCYYDSIYDSMLPTQEQIEAYYTANEETFKTNGQSKDDGDYYDVRHILLQIEGGTKDESGVTTYTDAEWEACRAAAQKMLDDFLANEPSEEKFAALAVNNSKDPGSASNGGLYPMLTKDYGFIEDFENWYTEEGRKPGDTGLVKNTQSSVQGYHIMYFCGSTPIWEHEARSALLSETTDKLLAEAEEKWPMEVKFNKIVLGNMDLA